MYYLFAASIVFAILAWFKGRPKGWLFPSDMFFLTCLIVVGLAPLLNPAAEEISQPYSFHKDTISSALGALSIMYITFALGWMARPAIQLQTFFPKVPNNVEWYQVKGPDKWLLRLAIAGVVLIISCYAVPSFVRYKFDVFRFLSGAMAGEQYQEARRILYAGDAFLEGVIGRFRFTIFPILIISTFVYLLIRFNAIVASCAAAILFIFGPASLSKAPIFVYVAYMAIAYSAVKGFRAPFRTRNIAALEVVLIPAILCILACSYYLQYPQTYQSFYDFPDALRLAFFRLLLADYSGLLQFFTVYPMHREFAGFSSIGIFSSVQGLSVRNVDAEVAQYYLGMKAGNLTTFPTIFVGGAYASFGYIGVAIYSIFVVWFLYFIDIMFRAIENRYIKIIYYSVVSVNVLYLAMLAAPTALVTYGCATVPALLLGLDRIVTAKGKRRRGLKSVTARN